MNDKKTFQKIRDESRKAKIELKNTLEKENGLEGHPKAQVLFDLAWDYGHAYGDNEVRSYYEDMAELLK